MTTISGANEIYRKLSSQVESQFPEFMREDGPNFIAFLKAYYEWMEQSGNAGEATRALFDYQDIDRTIESFVIHFHNEFMGSIPKTIIADKRLLAKHIREFNRTRGSQESYRLLFRILYDEEIDFYYPGEDILRASDGRWVQETVIRGTVVSGTPEDMDGRFITGAESGAASRVQEVLRITILGVNLIQLRTEQTRGTFGIDEEVSDGFGNVIKINSDVGSFTTNSSGEAKAITIDRGGAYHQVGDQMNLSGAIGGSGIVTDLITENTSKTFRIDKGGKGYRLGHIRVVITGGNPTYPATFSVVNLSSPETLNINTDLIRVLQNVQIRAGLTFTTQGANSYTVSATLAAANSASTITSALTFANTTTASINTIALTYPGQGYQGDPVVTVIDDDVFAAGIPDATYGGVKGASAVITPVDSYGVVTSVRIDTTNDEFSRGDTLTMHNITRSSANTTDTNVDTVTSITRGTIRQGTFDATGSTDIAGAFALPGRYIDTKGFLSWNNKLQDNYYYQTYSYVIRVAKSIDDYKNVIMATVHPGGTKMFGQMETTSIINATEITSDFIPFDSIMSEVATATETISSTLALAASILEGNAVILTYEQIVIQFLMSNYPGTIQEFLAGILIIDESSDASFGVTNTESVTAGGTEVAQVDFAVTNSESVTTTETNVIQVDFAGVMIEGNGVIQTYAQALIDGFTGTINDFLAGVLNTDDLVDASVA